METKSRIRMLDIMRGFAIFGTLGTNIWLFAHLGDLNYLLTFEMNWWSSIDHFLRQTVLFLVNGKLLGILTIMFGVGLELKYRQAMRMKKPWPGPYLLICLFLLLEGFLHFTLVMEYDILMSYAITAFIVSFIVMGGHKWIKRMLLFVGGLHVSIMILILIGGVYLNLVGANLSLGDMSSIATLYREGTWLEQVYYRLSDFVILRMEAILVIPMNIALFLVGVLLMRAGAFLPNEEGRRIRQKMLRFGLGVGLPLNMLIFIPGGMFDLPVRYLFAPILAVGYMALLAKLVEKKESLKLWNYFEAVGKMALSCYVFQNVVASAIFYGWGLGWGGKLGSPAIIGVWLFICVVQAIIAKWWLDRLTFGPLEWVRKSFLSLMTARPQVRGN